jgi:hypothetical protein
MTDDIPQLIGRYANKGVLVDTNLLLVYFVGQYSPARIGRLKHTEEYSKKEFDMLRGFLSRFHRIITTPNILTEVSNLSNHFGEPVRSQYFEVFAKSLISLDEHYLTSESLAQEQEFVRFGITDANIRVLAHNRFLVLTDDFRLSQTLSHLGIDAINFNHIRVRAW